MADELAREVGGLADDINSISGKHSGRVQMLKIINLDFYKPTDPTKDRGYVTCEYGGSAVNVQCRTSYTLQVGDWIYCRPEDPEKYSNWVYVSWGKRSDGTYPPRGTTQTFSINCICNDGGDFISDGPKALVMIDFPAVIQTARVICNASGAFTATIASQSYSDWLDANKWTAIATVAAGSASTGLKAQQALATATGGIAVPDQTIFYFTVSGVSKATLMTIELEGVKTG